MNQMHSDDTPRWVRLAGALGAVLWCVLHLLVQLPLAMEQLFTLRAVWASALLGALLCALLAVVLWSRAHRARVLTGALGVSAGVSLVLLAAALVSGDASEWLYAQDSICGDFHCDWREEVVVWSEAGLLTSKWTLFTGFSLVGTLPVLYGLRERALGVAWVAAALAASSLVVMFAVVPELSPFIG